MSEYIKFGDVRRNSKCYAAGETIRANDGVIFVREPSVMDVIEKFVENDYEYQKRHHRWDEHGRWVVTEHLYDTFRPAPPPAEEKVLTPEPKTVRLSWWKRLWLKLTRRKLPKAQLCENS